MAAYLLDTNVILGILRNSSFAEHIEQTHGYGLPDHVFAISTVTIGEIKSLALQRKWSEQKTQAHLRELQKLVIIPINQTDIQDRYAQIDAFSQGKLEGKSLGSSARNMGKNDLWIAASASVIDAKLLTTDQDFNHLDTHFIDLVYIDISSFLKG